MDLVLKTRLRPIRLFIFTRRMSPPGNDSMAQHPWSFGTFTFENQSRPLENRRKNLWISFLYSRVLTLPEGLPVSTHFLSKIKSCFQYNHWKNLRARVFI